MVFINIDKVFKINVYYRLKPNLIYTWVEKGEITLFGWPVKFVLSSWEEHYSSSDDRLYTPEDFKEANLVEYEPKQGLYYKPHIDVYTDSTRRKTTYFFETEEELTIWIEQNLKKWTNLIHIA